jgi:peptide deformylase
MIRPILKYGDEILHTPTDLVEAVTPAIDTLIGDMIDTMYAAPGIGLAAPQIGIALRIFVVDISLEEEGCLSVPGFNATVVRPDRAVVRGLDRNGVPHEREGTGLLARAFQHEMDHLDGMLFVDRLRGVKRDLIVRKIKKLSRAGKW